MFSKKFFNIVLFLCFALGFILVEPNIVKAATVTCNFIWPQQVVINGVAYSCDVGAGRGYCNYTKAQNGVAECCNWYEGVGYSNCAPIGPINPGASSPDCTDSDGGINYEVKGELRNDAGNVIEGDYCLTGYPGQFIEETTTGKLVEFYCRGFERVDIPSGKKCKAGALVTICTENWSCGEWSECLIQSCNTWPNCPNQQTRICTDSNNCGTTANKPATTQSCSVTCTDSDSGQDFYVKGNTTGIDTWKQYKNATETDYCTNTPNSSSVTEFYCYQPPSVEHPYINYTSMNCPYGCADGACKKACTEDWRCGGWSSCANGQQIRSCFDANSCGTTANKSPVTQSCTCQENWSCGSWSSCTNGQQTRTCADANSCGITSSQPTTSQSCTCTENWSCADWLSCVNDQQTRICSDSNNCGTTNFKPQIEKNCAAQTCAENWTCGEWSGCLNSKQTRACVDSGKCGTSKNKPITEQNCVCAEKWVCGDWTTCQNSQQTKTCTDLNNCGTAKNKPLTKQNCQVQPEPKPPLPASQPVPPPAETTPTAPLKTKAYIKDTKVTIEKKGEGVFTIVSGDTTMTTSLEVISSSSKPYIKTSQGLKEIKNSPEEIKAKVADEVNVINKIEIKEQNEKPLFSVSGVKKAKLLFLFPLSVKMEFQIDLEKGEIISIKKPWWSFLVKF